MRCGRQSGSWVAAVALLLLGCGAGSDAETREAGQAPGSLFRDDQVEIRAFDARQLGACFERANDDIIDGGSLVESVLYTDAWIRFDGVAGPVEEVDMVHAILDADAGVEVAGRTESQVSTSTVAMRRASRATELGASIYIGSSHFDGRSLGSLVVAVRGEDVAFLGNCESSFTDAIDLYADAHQMTPREAFMTIVTGELSATDLDAFLLDQHRPRSWDELDAHERYLDPDDGSDVPVPTSTVRVLVAVGPPEEQRGTLFCGRSEIARSSCYDLGAGFGETVFRVADGVPLELTLETEEEGGRASAPTVIETISWETLASAAGDDLVIAVDGLGDLDGREVPEVDVSVITDRELNDRFDRAFDEGTIEVS